MTDPKDLTRLLRRVFNLLLMAISLSMASILLLFVYFIDPNLSFLESKTPVELVAAVDNNEIKDGVHVRTGLIEAEGLMTVVNNCTGCHSAKLIMQNRMNEERWNKTIKWMQQTQNLWDLGENQAVIVNYLVTNYPPTIKGRRENLKDIEWYELDN